MTRLVAISLAALGMATADKARLPADFPGTFAECKPEVRLLHVQDSTGSFASVIRRFKDEKIIEGLLADLREEFGIVKYGISAFQDKPAPLVGYGTGYSVWQPQWNNISSDYCYKSLRPVSDDAMDDLDIWGHVHISGSKDGEENQLDGMARAAIDPRHWVDGEATHNEFGQPIARLALMVTDNFAHHGVKNDHHFWGFDVSYKGTVGYWNTHFGSLTEDRDVYRIVTDFSSSEMPVPYGPKGEMVDIPGSVLYKAYVACRNPSEADSSYRRGVMRSMRSAGVDFTGVDFDDESVDAWFDEFCRKEYVKNWSGKFTGVFEFVNDYKLVETNEVKEYPYQNIAFDASDDCTKYEYPDTSDPRYADMFKKFGVIPVTVVAPPASAAERESSEAQIRTEAHYYLANHCPKVRDTCSSASGKPIYPVFCTGPAEGLPHTEHLWTLEELDAKMADCLDEHYDSFFDNLKANGVASVYHRMDSGALTADLLAASMKAAVQTAISQLVCVDAAGTTAPVAPVSPGGGSSATVVGAAIGGSVAGGAVIAAVAYGFYATGVLGRRNSDFDLAVNDELDATATPGNRDTFRMISLGDYA